MAIRQGVVFPKGDRDGGQQFTKFYRFKNLKLTDEKGQEKKLSAMEHHSEAWAPHRALEVRTLP
jgi:hypothetical protein